MVAGSSRFLANRLIGECLEHAQKLRNGYVATQWSSLDDIITIVHVFILGVKVYPSLAMAVTAIELASTKAVELTILSIMVQLPLMAEHNPGQMQLSSVRRWLSRSHGVTISLPAFGDTTAIRANPYPNPPRQNTLRNQINAMKVQILHQYYPTNHPVPFLHRIPGNLMNKILLSDRSGLEKHLILWRANEFGRGKDRLCICLEPFTHFHTTSCAELASILVVYIEEMISRSEWAKLDTILHDWWTISNAGNIE